MDSNAQPLLFEISEPGPSWPGVLTPDAARAVGEEGGKLVLFTGHRALLSLGHYLMTWRLLHREPIVFVDGANLFDVHLITRLARGLHTDVRELLMRIHLSRAFTVHQLEAVVSDRLEEALRLYGSRLCLVSGLLDTFSDEEVRLWEATRILRRVTARLRRLAAEGNRIVVLAPDPPEPAPRRGGFMPMIVKAADRVFTLSQASGAFALKDDTGAARSRRWSLPSLPLSARRPPGR